LTALRGNRELVILVTTGLNRNPGAAAELRGRFADMLRCVDQGGGPTAFSVGISGVIDDTGELGVSNTTSSDPIARRCMQARVPAHWPNSMRAPGVASAVIMFVRPGGLE
jgi:hypothetical protein